MTFTEQAIDDFRGAWLDAEGNDFASRLQRKSLEAFADGNDALRVVLFNLKGEAQSELDLHLDGVTVRDHEADAASFAMLVRGITEATKEVAKHMLGRQRRASTLRILAPSPGSVRVVLRASYPEELDSGTVRDTRTPSVDSRSLDTVALLLARAQSDEVGEADDVLSGLAADLPQKAHAGLKRAAKAIEDQEWDVAGELRSERGFQAVNVGPRGAKALLRVLDERQQDSTQVELAGLIDGQRRSIGAMWFAPDGGGPIEAAVPSPELTETLVQLDAANAHVKAIFDVLIFTGTGANARRRRVYTLRSVEPIPELPTLFEEQPG